MTTGDERRAFSRVVALSWCVDGQARGWRPRCAGSPNKAHVGGVKIKKSCPFPSATQSAVQLSCCDQVGPATVQQYGRLVVDGP